MPRSYSLYTTDTSQHKGKLKYTCRKYLQIYKAVKIESTFIELLSSSGKNLIGSCIYRHPNMHLSEFNSICLNDILEKLSQVKNKSYFKIHKLIY